MHFKPKKSLGQNFLIDQNLQKKIISASGLGPQDYVLEIGSGRGELTSFLAERTAGVFAVEIDQGLARMLEGRFKDQKTVKVINKDILKLNLNRRFMKLKAKVKVIGNIPYYITSPIIAHLLKYRLLISDIFLMVQKEVAQRIMAHPGCRQYGALSCFLQYYTEPKIMFPIKKSCFRPKPKVDSVLINLKIRTSGGIAVLDEKLFFEIIRKAFNQRRKTLGNSLKEIIAKEKLRIFLKNHSLNPLARAEDLSLGDFANLANNLRLKKVKKVLDKKLILR